MKFKTNFFRLFSLFLVLIGITSCMNPIVIKDSGMTYNLSEDDPFSIELPGNPTTGYVWTLLPYDQTVVTQLGDPDYQVNDDKIGSGGLYTYKFQTVGDGQTKLVFEYCRKGDSVADPSRTFGVMIVCGTMGRILEE